MEGSTPQNKPASSYYQHPTGGSGGSNTVMYILLGIFLGILGFIAVTIFSCSMIFSTIVNSQDVYRKLKAVKLNDFLGQKLKKNNDESFSRYEYQFYDQERPDWSDNQRLREVEFNNGYLVVIFDMPVFEVKVEKKEEPINQETF